MTDSESRARPADGYRLISADSHVNEPPDTWTARVPQALKERAPRIESFEQQRFVFVFGVALLVFADENPDIITDRAIVGVFLHLLFHKVFHALWQRNIEAGHGFRLLPD